MNDEHQRHRTPSIAGVLAGVAIGCLAAQSSALAQAQISGYGRSSAPVYGGTGVTQLPANAFPAMRGTYADSHKAPDGTVCISVRPSARPQIVNPKIIDQLVTINNACGQAIKVQVCYSGSTDCITVPLSGYQKLQRILGIASSNAFRYEYRELF